MKVLRFLSSILQNTKVARVSDGVVGSSMKKDNFLADQRCSSWNI